MSAPLEPDRPETSPLQSPYGLLSFGGLAVAFIGLTQLVSPTAAFAVLLAGAIGVLLRWAAMPVLWLVLLAIALRPHPWAFMQDMSRLRLAELLLAGGVLCYCVSYYRLLAVTRAIFPRDTRRRGGRPRRRLGLFRLRWQQPVVPTKRPAHLVSTQEIVTMLLSLPAFAVAGEMVWDGLVWHNLYWSFRNPGLPPSVWQLFVLAWTVGAVLLLSHTALGWWTRRRWTAEQASLVLRDYLWKETRTEQRFISRWLAWAKLRQFRREEK